MLIKCYHEKTLFNNEATGYTIASYKTGSKSVVPFMAVSKYRPKDGKTAFTAVGNRLPTAAGVEIELFGEWVDGGKYGTQFSVGCNKESVGLRDIMTELAPYGVTPKKAEKILAEYGVQAVEIVKPNPYILCNIAGFRFKTVDEIARKNGMPHNAPQRIAEGIIYALSQAQLSGHLFLHSNELCENAVKLLELGAAESAVFKQALLNLVLEGRLREEDRRIYLPKNYVAEHETARLAKAMIKPVPIKGNVDRIIASAEKTCGITLADM